MDTNSFDKIVAAGRQSIKIRRVIGNNPNPRFESFHAPSSICSEKVRCVLFMKGADFIAYDVNISTQENYQPAYVAMRKLGRENRALIGQHAWTGSTSAAGMGFDPLVVPTLVDNLKKKVIVDSMTITNYLDQEIPSPPLYPKGCTEKNEKQIKLVDNTPHAGLLYGGDPDNDTRPDFIKHFTKNMVSDQATSLQSWLNDERVTPELRPLYEAKLKKLAMVEKTLQSKPDVLRNAVNITKQFMQELNDDLEKSGGPWICSDTFTMADIVWHVSLLRFMTFGMEYLYAGLPEVALYKDRIVGHPVLKKATFMWPGFLPSPYLAPLYEK